MVVALLLGCSGGGGAACFVALCRYLSIVLTGGPLLGFSDVFRFLWFGAGCVRWVGAAVAGFGSVRCLCRGRVVVGG